MHQNQDHTQWCFFFFDPQCRNSFSWYVLSFLPAWINFIDQNALCVRLGMNFVPQSFLVIFWYPVTDGALTEFLLIFMIPFSLFLLRFVVFLFFCFFLTVFWGFCFFFRQECCCLRIHMQMEMFTVSQGSLLGWLLELINWRVYQKVFGKG